MPNGDDANWVRVCGAVDGFRVRYGRWPDRVCVSSALLTNLRDHVLTKAGLAVVESVFAILPGPEVRVIAEGGEGEAWNFGTEGFPSQNPDPRTRDWFGEAILRPELRE